LKAVVYDRYGPPEVLRLEEVERPVPKDDEVLVKVHATTVNRSDCGWRSGKPFLSRFFAGLFRPKQRILGDELAGEVVAAGPAVTEFAAGDRVFGVLPYFAISAGTHAEFVCIRERLPLEHMPAGMSFEEAAAVGDGVMCALNALTPVEDWEGRRILVYGASGSIGTAAVQLAKHFGAHVTAVCNTKNVELVRSLGADEVIDYLHEDFTRNGERYDVILDAVGKHSFRRSRRSLTPDGFYLPTDGFLNIVLSVLPARIGKRKVRFTLPPRFTKEYIRLLKQLLESGDYRPVIDRRYPLEDVVEATRYVETEQKTGNVVLTLDGRSEP
jgi:NADPH:quinone reductase-like Zn-dependent oxidoreductase